MTPTVSVVMAAKNYARFLPQAIESVFAQRQAASGFADWELLIIDDGSTDSTPQAVQPYLADPRVKYIRSDRLGQSRAKNLGARLARGAYIAYLDADDAWLPTKLAKQLALLQANPAVGVCFTRRTIIDEAGHPRPANDPPAPRGEVLSKIFLRNFVCFSSVMVRRTVFDHVGLFDPQWDLSIDYDLWLRVAKFYEFDFIDEPLVLYRTGHGNLSQKLADRVATAEAIMTRAVRRNDLHPALVGEGYASTFRALAYTVRKSEPLEALKQYARALAWGGFKRETVKGLIKSSLLWASGRRIPGSPENSAANR